MLKSHDLLSEITFTTSRSSGPGGQNVNKVETKVTMHFDVRNSILLNDSQKILLLQKLSARLNKSGVLILSSQSGRSQLENKKEVMKKFDGLLNRALFIPKKRKRSRPSKGAVEKRLKEKRVLKERKERRKKI